MMTDQNYHVHTTSSTTILRNSYNKASSLGGAASAWTLDRIRDPPLFTSFLLVAD
jgi:hypothetical protein